MQKIGMFSRSIDAECLRFGLWLRFGLRCKCLRCQIASDAGRAMRTTHCMNESRDLWASLSLSTLKRFLSTFCIAALRYVASLSLARAIGSAARRSPKISLFVIIVCVSCWFSWFSREEHRQLRFGPCPRHAHKSLSLFFEKEKNSGHGIQKTVFSKFGPSSESRLFSFDVWKPQKKWSRLATGPQRKEGGLINPPRARVQMVWICWRIGCCKGPDQIRSKLWTDDSHHPWGLNCWPVWPLSWPPLFFHFSRHLFTLFPPLEKRSIQKSEGHSSFRTHLSTKFGKEIPSRNLHEIRPQNPRTTPTKSAINIVSAKLGVVRILPFS